MSIIEGGKWPFLTFFDLTKLKCATEGVNTFHEPCSSTIFIHFNLKNPSWNKFQTLKNSSSEFNLKWEELRGF